MFLAFSYFIENFAFCKTFHYILPVNYTDTCILLVEDDKAIAESLISGLQLEQYTCFHCSEAQTALETVQKNRVDIALLDIRLPGMDGLQLCRKFRDDGYNFPIIMLTARDEEIDKILGLEMGADDYMVKPYSFRELLSRIRAHLRRSREYPELSGNSLFLLGDVQIDRMRMRVYRNNKPVDITPVEFRLLTALITYESQPLSREQIIRQVWGENFYLEDPRTVDVHIRHLREKLESDPSQPAHIQTVRGFGYRLVKNP